MMNILKKICRHKGVPDWRKSKRLAKKDSSKAKRKDQLKNWLP